MTHHLHTTFSDGRDSPAAMLAAARALGWTAIGFSDHAPVEGEDWCMKAANLEAYFDARAEVGVTPRDWRTCGRAH